MNKVKTILKKIEDMSGVAIIAKYEIEEAFAELEEFEKECKKLIIESKKLIDETLDLGEIIIKQRKRIAELEEAMKSKSCDGCIRKHSYDDFNDTYCSYCTRETKKRQDNFKE